MLNNILCELFSAYLCNRNKNNNAMKSKRITKADLDGCRVEMFNRSGDLIASHYDTYDSLYGAINAERPSSRRYATCRIVNNCTGFVGEWKVSCPMGVVIGYRRID